MTELLTVDELADLLRTTSDAVYAARYRGDPLPPAIKVGRRILFRASAVERWLDESTEPTEENAATSNGRQRRPISNRSVLQHERSQL